METAGEYSASITVCNMRVGVGGGKSGSGGEDGGGGGRTGGSDNCTENRGRTESICMGESVLGMSGKGKASFEGGAGEASS